VEICLFLLINKLLRIKEVREMILRICRILKFCFLFATMATIVFLVVSIVASIIASHINNYASLNIELSALIIGLLAATIIFVLDNKFFHFYETIHQYIDELLI